MINMPNLNFTQKGCIPEKIRLNFVFKDGKLYIQNLSENDIVIANSENGVQILDEERPSLDAQDVDNFEYNLQGLTKRKMQDFHSGRYGIWRWQILRH